MTEAGEKRLPPVSWVRGHLVLVAVLGVVIVGLVVLTVVAFGGSGNPPSSSGNPVGSKAASAQAASTQTKGSKWLAGSEAKALTAVTTDLARVMTTERSGSHGAAAKAAGAQLAADATTALGGPMPPVEAATYQRALQDLKVAGTSAAGGTFGPRAAGLLAAGQAGIMKVTAAADMPVPVKTPAIPEPNGQ
jgi:hypothetical protein